MSAPRPAHPSVLGVGGVVLQSSRSVSHARLAFTGWCGGADGTYLRVRDRGAVWRARHRRELAQHELSNTTCGGGVGRRGFHKFPDRGRVARHRVDDPERVRRHRVLEVLPRGRDRDVCAFPREQFTREGAQTLLELRLSHGNFVGCGSRIGKNVDGTYCVGLVSRVGIRRRADRGGVRPCLGFICGVSSRVEQEIYQALRVADEPKAGMESCENSDGHGSC